MKQTHEDLWMAENNRNEGLDDVYAQTSSSVAELKQFCREVWAKSPPQWGERLIASYRRCLIAVLAAKGGANIS